MMNRRSLARSHSLTIFAGAAAWLAVSSLVRADQSPAAKPKEPTVTLATRPARPATGTTAFTVAIADAEGKPVSGAEVTLTLVMAAMPSMNMPEMRNSVALKPIGTRPADAGKYSGTGQIMMAGKWDVIVTAKVKDKTVVEKKLTLTAK